MTSKLPPKPKLKVNYDAETGFLWLGNGRPLFRSVDVSKDRITVFFESTEPVPSALRVSSAAELLGPFFGPPEAPVSKSCPVVYGDADESAAETAIEKFLDPATRESDSLVVIHNIENGDRIFEKFLKSDDLDIYYESEGDTLALGNGRPAPCGGYDIAEGLIVFFEAEGVPVHIEFFDAAEHLVPVLPRRSESKTAESGIVTWWIS